MNKVWHKIKATAVFLALILFATSVWATKTPNDKSSKDKSSNDFDVEDPGPFSLSANERIQVVKYDSELKIYQIVTVDDPTREKIYVSPETLLASVQDHFSSLLVLETPTSIVGIPAFYIDKDMPVLWAEDLLELKKQKALAK